MDNYFDIHKLIIPPFKNDYPPEAMLLAISPIDGRYAKNVAPLRNTWSESALMYYRVLIEVLWLLKLNSLKIIPVPFTIEQEKALFNRLVTFSLLDCKKIKEIETTTRHDVKAIEYLLQEWLQESGLKEAIPWIHFGCTSEDINNTSYALMLKTSQHYLTTELTAVIDVLACKINDCADIPMLAHTHGQPASPTTVGKEFANIAQRLWEVQNQIAQCQIAAKWNGATGNCHAQLAGLPNFPWLQINSEFIHSLTLHPLRYTTQIEPHDQIATLLHAITRLSTIVVDLSRDMWLYISKDYFIQTKIQGEIGSSVMPHKINPIDFENAEGNALLAQTLAVFLAGKLPQSRMQRDLTDSTTLRNLGLVFAYIHLSLQGLTRGLSRISANIEELHKDLHSHPEVLAEALQSRLRVLGFTNAYELLKEHTQGAKLDMPTLNKLIHALPISEEEKKNLTKLSPANYLGYAPTLAKEWLENWQSQKQQSLVP